MFVRSAVWSIGSVIFFAAVQQKQVDVVPLIPCRAKVRVLLAWKLMSESHGEYDAIPGGVHGDLQHVAISTGIRAFLNSCDTHESKVTTATESPLQFKTCTLHSPYQQLCNEGGAFSSVYSAATR